MASHPDTAVPDEPIRFRSGKKRKAYRQRDDSSPPPPQAAAVARPDSNNNNDDGDEEDDGGATTTAAALRLRNARKQRAGGVGFTATGSRDDANTSGAHSSSSSSKALVPSSQDGSDGAAVIQGMTNRFTHQTGLVSSLNDRHMTEYIESRLSRRSDPSTASSQHPDPHNATKTQAHPTSIHPTFGEARRSNAARDPTVEQPTRQGRLMEVDLSQVPTRRPPNQNQTDIAPAPKKPRLGPDGKPWRGRKRRASDDVKRDQLVEEFLHENRLDVYDTTQPSNPLTDAQAGPDGSGAPDDGTTADDRLAEQFQRQYMDDLARRRQQQRKKPAAQGSASGGPGGGGAGGAASEDVLKGPKLGGSRNARAAVRDALLRKEKEARK